MKLQLLMVSCALMLIAGPAAGQGAKPAAKDEKPAAAAVKDERPAPRVMRPLTNVQIELTITDQVGSQAPEKKIVSMIVSNGSWGKIRSAGNSKPIGETPLVVQLDVDARPFMIEGQVQLELTVVYAPPGLIERDNSKFRPTNVNQSQTVILHSGTPMVVSQAADPVSDRKVTVEVKATVLK